MYKLRVYIYLNHVPFDARQKSYGFTRHLKFAILSPTNVDSMPQKSLASWKAMKQIKPA